jgi:hypothetical protein
VFEPQLSANQRLNQMSKPKFFIPFFFFLWIYIYVYIFKQFLMTQ